LKLPVIIFSLKNFQDIIVGYALHNLKIQRLYQIILEEKAKDIQFVLIKKVLQVDQLYLKLKIVIQLY
jgi:hypothetical protein